MWWPLLVVISLCALPPCSGIEAASSDAAVNTGVFVHGDQLLISGVVRDDSMLGIQENSTDVKAAEELAESLEEGDDGTHEWLDDPDLESDDDGETPKAAIQDAHPASLLMNQASNLGQVSMPISMLETDEYAWSVPDSVMAEAREKAAVKRAEVEAKAGRDKVMAKALNSPENKAKQEEREAVRATKAADKKQLDRVEQEEKQELKQESKELKKKKEADDELQAQGFEENEQSNPFKQDGKALATEFDDAMPPPKDEPAPDLALSGSYKKPENSTDTESVKPVSWRVKIGMVRNFAPNPRVVTKTIASVQHMHAVDVARIRASDGVVSETAFVLHEHQLSRVDLSTGAVNPVAGSTAGLADGTGSDVKFHHPSDLAVFSDPKEPDSWMLLVADKENDQLRLVKDPLGKGETSTVLQHALVEIPRRVAVVESRQHTPDQMATNARKMFAFVICGKNTVVRVENILGRKRVASEPRAYESTWETTLRKKDKEMLNENAHATVHMLSSKFMHLTDIAIAKEQAHGGERIVAFVVDRKAGMLFRLDDIIEGERRVKITEVGNTPSKSRSFLAINSGTAWFGIAGQAGKDLQQLHRIDEVMEGKREATSSALFAHNSTGRLRSIAAMENWDGRVFFTLDAGQGRASLVQVDMSLPLVCKDQVLLGSTEFNELGELESLGLVQQETKPIRLGSWVAAAPPGTNETKWRVLLFRAARGRVCAVSSTVQDPHAGVFAYYCKRGMCNPA